MRQALSSEGFANIFANFLGQRLEQLVEPDGERQVYGVAGLPTGLLEASCNNLRIRADFEGAFVLTERPSSPQHITADSLNARARSEPGANMVVFVPEEVREAAEELFSSDFFTPVDTFRSLEDVEEKIIGRINKVPVYKRIATIWSVHAAERLPILKRIDYLINIVSLCLTHEDMGMFFHKLDLIPDRKVDITGNFSDRLSRNILSMTILCQPEGKASDRVKLLELADQRLAERLTALLEGLDSVTPETVADAIFAAESGETSPGLSFENWRFEGETGWT